MQIHLLRPVENQGKPKETLLSVSGFVQIRTEVRLQEPMVTGQWRAERVLFQSEEKKVAVTIITVRTVSSLIKLIRGLANGLCGR